MSANALQAPQRLRKSSTPIRTPSRSEKRSQRRTAPENGVKRFPFIGSDALPQYMWDWITLVPETGCWLWTGYKDKAGYGITKVNRKSTRAHRATFLLFRGYLPDWKRGKGLCLDHYLFPDRCIGPSCVHPYHLRVVTPRQNILRSKTAPAAIAARRTSCPQGHPYSEDNVAVYVHKSGRKYRRCITCNRKRSLAWQKKNREKWRGYQRDWTRNKRASR